jgi:hypothetical protein
MQQTSTNNNPIFGQSGYLGKKDPVTGKPLPPGGGGGFSGQQAGIQQYTRDLAAWQSTQRVSNTDLALSLLHLQSQQPITALDNTGPTAARSPVTAAPLGAVGPTSITGAIASNNRRRGRPATFAPDSGDQLGA